MKAATLSPLQSHFLLILFLRISPSRENPWMLPEQEQCSVLGHFFFLVAKCISSHKRIEGIFDRVKNPIMSSSFDKIQSRLPVHKSADEWARMSAKEERTCQAI